jgi:site-specific DNA recombinase
MSTALYVRVSSERQTLAQTLDQQIERLTAYVQAQGEIVCPEQIFRDDGYSGATLNRPGLDRLRDRVKEGTIDRVLMASPDRLARHDVHQMVLLEEFAQAGCGVECLDQPLGQDPQAPLRLHIRGAVAEYERTLIAERMRRGRQRKLPAGGLLPWTIPPYGYRLHPDRPRDPAGVQIEPTEGAMVQEVFARSLEADGTLLGLAKHPLQLGLRSPRGNRRWSAASLHGLLSNPASTGKLSIGRTQARPARLRRSATHPLGKPAYSQDPTPPESWTLVTIIPALVSQEDFDRVQAKLALNKQRASRNNKSHTYLLRALVSCGVCQSACITRTTTHGHRYYVCRCAAQPLYSQRDHRCTARYSPAQQLDELVWHDLCDLLTHPEWIAYALERAHGGHWLPQELQARKEALRKGQMSATNQLERLTEAYLQGVIPLVEYQRRRQELEQKHQALATQEKQLAAQVDRQGQLAEMRLSIQAFCQRVQAGLAQATFAQKRTLVEVLVDRVLVVNGNVEIRYAIPTHPRSETTRFCHVRKDYFHDIIEILHLPDGDGGTMLVIIPPDGGGLGLAPINGDLLRHPMPADRLAEEARGGLLISVGGEEEVNGLSHLIDSAIEVAPLPFDLDVRLIHPPTDPHRPLAAVERGFELGTILHHPTVDGGVVDRHTALLHQLFDMTRAQGIGDIPPHTGQDNILREMGPLEAHHALSPSRLTLGHRGRSYLR